MGLATFSENVKGYLKAAGYSQKMLANALGLDPSLLNHKLNGTGRTILTHPEVKEIIKQLATYEAITRQSEAMELLALVDCPNFSQEAWKTTPLNKLELEFENRASSVSNTESTGRNIVSTSQKNLNQVARGTTSTLPTDFGSTLATAQPDNGLKPCHNLPQLLSSFIGRHKEVGEIKKLIVEDKVRVLTLVGTGGCGKTRLSLQVAAEVLDHFRDGVWFIELAPLTDPALIPQTIALALGLAERNGKSFNATLQDYLRTRQLLLVLDNCEHLIEECARVVETLLHASSRVQILASSREAFCINGETIFRVPSLSLPDPHMLLDLNALPGYEAVALFLERARVSNPHFTLTQNNAAAVAELCSQLDGIPLALELAAARIGVLTVDQIVERLNARFELLTRGSRTALPRQQTLRRLVDWSYELLSATEKTLLAELSVFAGGWTLSAAIAVCGGGGRGKSEGGEGLSEYEILDGLTGLVNKSLVQLDENKEGNVGEARYFFLETIRQYGLEKLQASGEKMAVRERHSVYFTTFVRELGLKMLSKELLPTLKALDLDLDNIRTAMDILLKSQNIEKLLEMTSVLRHYYSVKGYFSEIRLYIEQTLSLPGAREVNRIHTLFDVGLMAHMQGEIQTANIYFEETHAFSNLHKDNVLQVKSLMGLGLLPLEQGKYREARRYFEQALLVAEEPGLLHGVNRIYKIATQANLCLAMINLGELEKARGLIEEAVAADREMGNQWGLAMDLLNSALVALAQQDFPTVQIYLEEALRLSDEIDFPFVKYDVLTYLGIALYHQNKFKESGLAFEASLAIKYLPGNRRQATYALIGTAGLLSKLWLTGGKAPEQSLQVYLEQVACLGGAIAAFESAQEKVLFLPLRGYYEEALAVARSGLSEDTFGKAFAKGQTLTLEEVTTYARQILSDL